MKKLLLITLSLTMLLMTAACGSNDADSNSSAESSYSETDSIKNDTQTTPDEDTQPPADEDADAQQPEENKDDTAKKDPAQKPAEKPAEKPAQKPAQKPAEKPAQKPAEKPAQKPAEKPAASKGYNGTLPELINAVYAKNPVELMIGDPMAIDLQDADILSYHTGLTDGSQLKEAYVSEAMIGSLAYSMVVVRTNDAADAVGVAQSMFDNINMAKWICVAADTMTVGVYGDTVMLVMLDSVMMGGDEEHPDTEMDNNLVKAFASVCGGKLDKTLTK